MPKLDGTGDSLNHQRPQALVIDLLRCEQANGNLGRTAVQRRPQSAPALIAHMNKHPSRRSRFPLQVRSIYPGMTATQSSSSAVINSDDGNGVGQDVPRAKLEQPCYVASWLECMRIRCSLLNRSSVPSSGNAFGCASTNVPYSVLPLTLSERHQAQGRDSFGTAADNVLPGGRSLDQWEHTASRGTGHRAIRIRSVVHRPRAQPRLLESIESRCQIGSTSPIARECPGRAHE